MILNTERLVLKLLSDEEILRMIENEQNLGLKKAYSCMYENSLKNPLIREWSAIWGIFLKLNNTMVGSFAFKGLPADGKIEIGYGIESHYENNGYTTEAVKEICKWASNQNGISCIIAEVEDENIASIRVLEKSGFDKTSERSKEGAYYKYINKNL